MGISTLAITKPLKINVDFLKKCNGNFHIITLCVNIVHIL